MPPDAPRAGRLRSGDRQTALRQLRDTAKLQRLAMQAGQSLGLRMRRAATGAMRRGADPVAAVGSHFDAARDLLVELMVTSHLDGRRRTMIAAAPRLREVRRLSLGTSVFNEALRFLQRRLEVPDDELARLRGQYGEEALRVTRRLEDHVERRLVQAVQATAREGEHVRRGVARISEAFSAAGVDPDNAFTFEAVFRTQTQTAYGAGRWNALRNDPAVDEILWGFRYSTVGDDRVRAEHAMLEGTTLPKDDPFWQANWPPNGWACRCFLPGTRVQGNFVAGSKAWYAGMVVEIETARGRRLSVTANHPILTSNGWVAASQLDEGDTLFSHRSDIEPAGLGGVCDEHAPPAIEDVFDSFARHGTLVVHPRPLDFNGDAKRFVGDVNVVVADRHLSRNLHSTGLDGFGNFNLAFPDVAPAFAPSAAHLTGHCGWALVNPLPLDQFSLRGVADSYPTRGEDATRRAPRDAEPAGGGVLGLAAQVGVDDRLNIKRSHHLDVAGGIESVATQKRDRRSNVDAVRIGDRLVAEPVPSHLQHGIHVGLELGGRDLRTCWDAMPAKAKPDGGRAHTTFIAKLMKCGSGSVAADKIVKIRRVEYAGHVYDLQSDKGWLWADGIAAANCTTIELFEDHERVDPLLEAEIDGEIVRGGADEGFAFNPGEMFRDPRGEIIPA